MNHRTLAVGLTLVVLAAGCTAPPGERAPTSGNDVRVDVADASGDPVVITVGVAPAGHQGFAVEFANGSVREYPDARGIEDLPDAVVPRIVSLRPIGDDTETRTYRWSSQQTTTAVFEDVPRNATVFYSVAAPSGTEPLRTLGRLTCGPEATLTDVFVHVNAAGSVAAGNNCHMD